MRRWRGRGLGAAATSIHLRHAGARVAIRNLHRGLRRRGGDRNALHRHDCRAVARPESPHPVESDRRLAAEPLVGWRLAGPQSRRIFRRRHDLDAHQRGVLALHRRKCRKRRRLRARQRRVADVLVGCGLRPVALLHGRHPSARLFQRHAGGALRGRRPDLERADYAHQGRRDGLQRQGLDHRGSEQCELCVCGMGPAHGSNRGPELLCRHRRWRLHVAGSPQHLRSGPAEPDSRQPDRGVAGHGCARQHLHRDR